MMGKLKYFLGFEVKQQSQGTFINQAKYTQDMLKRFNMNELNPPKANTPMPLKCYLIFYPNGKVVD